ncbi:3-methyl-2-oxobutanoate hydroxymethyltransferase [Chloropicon primus]|uniref:3-methyl-2-oxobutanoate hydroxymethyltransferase n=1 Tax=Chloropicon primus TaxID=1764295 RepID=A0A5B8MPB0_9CHLO|nr:3-methyl-2-oxobutanoate hydroxymethyltransferase [Chloropicon primus]|eukprot:QDZ21435.1 3-methyl-2-oxobutanoate hydroxymethyltransferase [Chloropicon primus]
MSRGVGWKAGSLALVRAVASAGKVARTSTPSSLAALPAPPLAIGVSPGGLLERFRKWSGNLPRSRQYSSSGGGREKWGKLEASSVYGTGSSPKSHIGDRVTTRSLARKYRDGGRISVITAYDFSSSRQVDTAGADIVLVGDSAGMVVHGYDTTLPLTLDELLSHCRAVARGARRALCVGDLPFGSYESSAIQCIQTSVRVLKEGVMDAVKIEGGNPKKLEMIEGVVQAGIAVMGHTGLTPQSISVLGGFRSLGKSAREAEAIYDQALRLQDAGCFSVVLECIPSELAAAITRKLDIPTIGIGSGPGTSGQVLVYHDMLGMLSHPHHESVTPSFAKRYASLGQIAHEALSRYCRDVEQGSFPSEEYSPYAMSSNQKEILMRRLRERGHTDIADALSGFE